MKNVFFFVAALLMLFLCLPQEVEAQVLPIDLNGVNIQMPRYTTAVRDSIPSQAAAVYDSIAVPTDAVECTMIFMSAAGKVYTGTAKKLTADAVDWIYVPVGQQFTFPVMDVITYVKYKSWTGANSVNIVWKRL